MINGDLKRLIKEVPNFPKPGVQFKDLSHLFTYKLRDVSIRLNNLFNDTFFDYVAGVDARGFIIGTAIAMNEEKHFLPIRKIGKLPGRTVSYQYQSEYSTTELEMSVADHADGHFSYLYNRVLIVDDVLATGGTFKAASELCQLAGYHVVGFASIVDLRYLNKFEIDGMKCRSLIQYD
jgi:adenine phosphoribosyltransferase